MNLIDSFYTWEDTIMFHTHTRHSTHTHTDSSVHTKSTVTHTHTHSHSTMLLSHSPRSHFSQSPRVCEGQSGLSSHKPGLHTRLPVKVCVRTECYSARRNSKGKMERTQTTCNTMRCRTLSRYLGSSCLTVLEITI